MSSFPKNIKDFLLEFWDQMLSNFLPKILSREVF
jgi:hypothetical protein